MGKLSRRDIEALEVLDRSLAFDRMVDPFLFPADIICQKYIFDGGVSEHVFHHRTLGEVGRIRIEARGGRTHIGGLVSGDTEDPLHGQRDALFRPLMEQFARVANHRCVQGKHMPCDRCGAIAASLIFIDGGEPDDFENHARLMYAEYSHGTAPVWIIGPPVGSGPEAERAADILKVWPEREPIQRMSPAQFNPICARVVANHCPRKLPRTDHQRTDINRRPRSN